MERTIRDGLQVLRRARDFLQSNEVTTPMGPITQHVRALSDVIVRLSTYAVQQDASVRAAAAGTRSARDQVRQLRWRYLRPMAQLSRTLFVHEDGLRRAFRMPKVDDYEGLIAGARAMAEQASAQRERFVAAGFGEDFVERVQAAADALQKTLNDRDDAYGDRSLASAGMWDQMKRGGNVLRLLDLLVSGEWADTPDRLAKWKALSRFDHPSKSNGDPTASEQEATAVIPPTAVQAVAASGTVSPPVATAAEDLPSQKVA